MRNLTLLAVALLLLQNLSAQDPLVIRHYHFPDKIEADYQVNSKKDYNKILNGRKSSVSKKDYSRFAEYVAYQKKARFESGQLYIGWTELEAYLNEMVKLLFPDENIKVYIQRDAAPNAFALHDGTLLINIGLLASVENEAALAAALAHEVAHYLNKDVEAGFLEGLKMYTKRNRNKNYEMQLDHAHSSRERELIADSLGFEIAARAGYDISYGLSNFYLFQLMEATAEQLAGNSATIENVKGDGDDDAEEEEESNAQSLASHPDLPLRIAQLERMMSRQSEGNKAALLGQGAFEHWQEIARVESLALLADNNYYWSLMSQAFSFHLYDPENPVYQYYLTEGLRRYLNIIPDNADDGFLNDYSEDLKKGQGILRQLQHFILDSTAFAGIEATHLMDTSVIEFDTYEEAFHYFLEQGLDNNINELHLSHALYRFDKSNRDSLLQLYVAADNVLYKDFANALLSNRKPRGSKDVVVLGDILFIQDHFYGLHNHYLKTEKKAPAYFGDLEKMIRRKFRKDVIVYDDEIKGQLNYLLNLKEITSTGMLLTAIDYMEEEKTDREGETYYFSDSAPKQKEKKKREEQGEEEELFNIVSADPQHRLTILKPEFYQFMQENKLETVEWIEVMSYDDRTYALNYANPLFWVFVQFNFISRVVGGDPQYKYLVTYSKYDPKNKELPFSVDAMEVSYKMKKAHLQDTVWRLIYSNN